jgi:putative transcriptional regulator
MDDDLRVEAGTLLAAWPDLMDPNFMHSVVLVCQHSEEGAYGLVTNRATQFKASDLLTDHPTLKESDFPVFLGGPVDHTTLQFLHTVPDEIPGGLCLDGKLWLGGELDALGRFVTHERARALGCVRVFLGYSGWGAGQLESELAIGSWIPAPPAMEAIFGEEGESTWRRVVRSIGRAGADLENLPPDVSWN